MLYASGPDGLWAVLVQERTHPTDVGQESAELPGLYGAAVHGIGHLLQGDGVVLPPVFASWATAPDVPLGGFGPWRPCLVTVDGSAQLALTHDLDDLQVLATTWKDVHVVVVTPAGPVVVLVHRDDLDAPARGWDQRTRRGQPAMTARPRQAAAARSAASRVS